MASPRRAATLLFHSKVQVIHRASEEVAIAELKIFDVPESPHYPEGRKFSLFLVWRESGEVIVGFDNHKPKGPHLHRNGREEAYEFKDVSQLVEDFWSLVRMEGFLV
ncbi:MAG: hypothetical protein KA715_12920 [Xanthomonadaceae bacterium]|nr:hypothetical protein [Xanthomonadaceae bacterium]